MRPRFSIRDLLWLTLVIGVCVGWYLEHRKWVGMNDAKPRLAVYPVKYGNINAILSALNALAQATPGVRASVDPTAKTVIVLGNQAAQQQAKSIIEQLDQPPSPAPQPPAPPPHPADDASPGT
jgi:hypothetical protein